jgi:hypothetical protein
MNVAPSTLRLSRSDATAAPFVTIFANKSGSKINAAREMNFAELERVIRTAPAAAEKDKLALLKAARFGEMRTDKGSLRHDANVLEVFGIEGDYDGERIPMSQAAEALSNAGIAALLYTSASHTDELPRWRVLVALSAPLEGTPDELRQQRRHWTGVLNAILGDVLNSESFSLSQSYYFGRIQGRPDPDITRLSGTCLDQMEEPPAPVFPANGMGAKPAAPAGDVIGEDRSRDLLKRVAEDVRAGKADYQIHALHAQHPHVLDQADPVRTIQRAINKAREDCGPKQANGQSAKPCRVIPPDAAEAKPAAWPDPVNILGEMSAPEFTGDELPPVLSEFALAFARSTGFDPSLTLSASVSVAAAALSDHFQIVGDSRSQWFQQARLWILNIGRPGTGKTPVQKAMLGPLWAIQKALTEEHDQAVATLPEGEKAPPIPRVIIGDATIEALSERLRGNPRGILLANDEFESWLGSHDTYRAGAVSRDRGEWLRLFDGGPHTIERIQRGSVYVENWGASILTATTPAALVKLTRSLPEDGLLQRFIPVIVRGKREPERIETLDAARIRYAETIKRLFAATPRAHNGCVPLSVDAQEFLQVWMRQSQLTQEAFGTLEPALESHLSKYPSFLLRLALTFHAANIVNQQHELARDPAAFPVPLTTIETAARFLKRATLHAIALYLDRRSGNDVYELARETARAILARGWTMVERRHLIQTVRAFRKASDDLQDSALRLFVDMGWLRYAEGGYMKRTPARYEVNPSLPAKFASVAQRERERRAVIRDVIAGCAQDRREGSDV